MDENRTPTLEDLKERMAEAKSDMPYMDASVRAEMKTALFWMNFFISEIEEGA